MTKISAQSVEFYPQIIQDYITGKLREKNLVDWEYSWETLEDKIDQKSIDEKERSTLHSVLKEQYSSLSQAPVVEQNIELLLDENTRTVTTGHQITLFGGPLFVFTKVFEVIQLAKTLKTKYSDYNFVPVLWLATEDHDFEEISEVNLFHEKFKWETEQQGAVGKMHLKELQEIKQHLIEKIGDRGEGAKWQKIIDEAYAADNSLSQAMQHLLHEVFREEGLVILEPDHQSFKALFLPVALKELETQFVSAALSNRSEALDEYKLLVNARPINLFYLEDGKRERIVIEENQVGLSDGSRTWSKEAFIEMVKASPECVSPNVTLRPVYQEMILPNVAYVGGAGEVSYWLQLTDVFKALDLQFPLPIVRTSFVLLKQKQMEKLETFGLQLEDLFLREDMLENAYVEKQSSSEINLGEYKGRLSNMFSELQEKGVSIDPNLKKVVLGEQKRALGVIENLEKRFRGAEKNNHTQAVNQIKNIRSKVLPDESFQERKDGFLQYIVMLGLSEIKDLYKDQFQCFNNELVFLPY